MPATGALANRPFAHAMQRLETSCSTGLMATIYGARHRFSDPLCIAVDIADRHQPRVVAGRLDLPTQVMRLGYGGLVRLGRCRSLRESNDA
jgi:hypothetical protein